MKQSVKEQILLLLMQAGQGSYLSGQEIARKLSVSRAAVWKAIQSLREQGYAVDAVQNRGYALAKEADFLSAASITELLSDAASHLSVCVAKSLPSTNDLLKQYAAQGRRQCMVALAEEQISGRGRFGRVFFSPMETGVYMSVLLYPDLSIQDSILLSTMAAAAAARAIEELSGEETQIKWVNDIWMHGKKVAGILTEASISLENSQLEYAVLGIGINVYEPRCGFPDGLSGTASSIFPSRGCINNFRNQLAAEVLNNLMEFYPGIRARSFLPEYRKRLFVLGQDIYVKRKGGVRRAKALALDDSCRLKVRYENGAVESLGSGEISVGIDS